MKFNMKKFILSFDLLEEFTFDLFFEAYTLFVVFDLCILIL